MNAFLNTLERKFDSWTIPGIIRYLAILFVGVFLMSAFNPDFSATLDFNYPKILDGEWWRLVTFVFAPQVGSFSPIMLLFLVFGTLLMFSFSDALEEQWGCFRTNLFVLWGFLGTLAANLIYAHFYHAQFGMSGIYLAVSILFAFATYNPKYKLMIMMIIPCPIWVIAMLTGVPMLIGMLTNPFHGAYVALCLSNYLVVAIPMFIKGAKNRGATKSRRKKFSREFSNKRVAFHTCCTCGANDITHPDEEFRVGNDGNDYCSEHLPG